MPYAKSILDAHQSIVQTSSILSGALSSSADIVYGDSTQSFLGEGAIYSDLSSQPSDLRGFLIKKWNKVLKHSCKGDIDSIKASCSCPTAKTPTQRRQVC